MRKIAFAPLFTKLLLLFSITAHSQPSSGSYEIIQRDHPVDTSIQFPLVEPNLAAHPQNPNHLLGTAIIVGDDDFGYDCAAFASLDGGKTWSVHTFGLEFCGDPWVEILSDGTGIFVGLSSEGMALFRSSDGGMTWESDPKRYTGGFDHPMLSKEIRGQGEDDILYLAASEVVDNSMGRNRFSIFINRSENSGSSLKDAVNIIPNNLTQEAMGNTVLSDGTLVVAFGDHGSPNGRLETRRSWIIKSGDHGKTFSEPLFITEQCNAPEWPALVADTSEGDYKDRLYWICGSDDFKGIQLFLSDNKGENWTKTGNIGYSGDRKIKTRIPEIAVNNESVVGVAWYGVSQTSDGPCYDIYFSSSIDGSETFLPVRKISTKTSCPNTEMNKNAFGRWPVGGDYSGLAAGADGTFHILWSDSRSGIYSLRTTAIRVNE